MNDDYKGWRKSHFQQLTAAVATTAYQALYDLPDPYRRICLMEVASILVDAAEGGRDWQIDKPPGPLAQFILRELRDEDAKCRSRS